jgi:hypothetical protein
MPTPQVALTTVDNPYNPFTQFESWFLYDEEKNYHTCGLLARIADVNSDMTDEDYDEEVERAVDEIIRNDFTNLYRKVKK